MGSAGQGHAQADAGASPFAGIAPPPRGAPGGRRRGRRPPGFHFGSAHLGREPRCAGRPVHRRAAAGGCAMNDPPRFAVVGRVNKGKSSIVATLAEDDTVRIDPRPGTTTEVREYPVRVDGRTLFVLVDTPGFEDAPRALAWLRSRQVSAPDRPARVAELLRAYQGTGEFADERKLLAPILAGANVLYVVDGTRPFRRNYEAEMEILRWTGRPGMALVNRIGDEDYGLEWHRALDQYFKMVRDFDAFSVSFEERLKLLESFRELRPESRAAIDEAITALTAQRRRRRADAGSEIADLLLDELTHTEEIAVAHEAALEAERDRLERSFHDHLREREEKARRRVEGLYAHGEVRFETTSLDRPIFQQDLFAEETWRLLGLAPVELVAASTLAGAISRICSARSAAPPPIRPASCATRWSGSSAGCCSGSTRFRVTRKSLLPERGRTPILSLCRNATCTTCSVLPTMPPPATSRQSTGSLPARFTPTSTPSRKRSSTFAKSPRLSSFSPIPRSGTSTTLDA